MLKPLCNIQCRGLTLVELLIAMVLGIIVTGTILTVFATTVRYNSDNLQMIRLNQELRGAMSLISRDLRRAGYFNSATATTTYLDQFGGSVTGDCIYFAYDIDADGTVNDYQDYIAFKLEDGEIKAGNGVTEAVDCSPPSSSSAVSWEAITEYDSASDDRSDIQITVLQFQPKCAIAGGSVASSFTCSGGVEVRNVVITITGQIITPVDSTVVSRTLTETIKLRNNSGV